MMKKFIAMAAALACAMTVASPAFAAVAGTATASHDNGIVKLSSTADISADKQWTVVIISKDLQNATLEADDLLYINQGTSVDSFWAVDGMGTKGGALADGEYIIRIGGQSISSAGDLIEIEFEVGEEGILVEIGDINMADGIGGPDLALLLGKIAGTVTLTADQEKLADLNGADGIGGPDLALLLGRIAGTVEKIGDITVSAQ